MEWIIISAIVALYIGIPLYRAYCPGKHGIPLFHRWSESIPLGRPRWDYWGIGEIRVVRRKRWCRRCGKIEIFDETVHN